MQNQLPEGIEISFIAGFGPVVADQQQSERFYLEILGIPMDFLPKHGSYYHTFDLPGVKYFALWPLSKAAENCFGKTEWPEDIPVPQAWLEIEVEDVEKATRVLEEAGYPLLTRLQKEPWGQIATRFLTPEGTLASVCWHPQMHNS